VWGPKSPPRSERKLNKPGERREEGSPPDSDDGGRMLDEEEEGKSRSVASLICVDMIWISIIIMKSLFTLHFSCCYAVFRCIIQTLRSLALPHQDRTCVAVHSRPGSPRKEKVLRLSCGILKDESTRVVVVVSIAVGESVVLPCIVLFIARLSSISRLFLCFTLLQR
jgi:hypothetical protein